MRFGATSFSALRGGAGDVEIAERDVIEACIFAVIGEDFFKGELGLAVGVDRGFGMVLGNGNDFGFAVSGRGGRKDEFSYAVARDGVLPP